MKIIVFRQNDGKVELKPKDVYFITRPNYRNMCPELLFALSNSFMTHLDKLIHHR